jgi:hypothetical protein
MPGADGGIVDMRSGRPGAGTSGAAWGVAAVMTLTVAGFLVATALVIALARTSTARWERASRAAVAARRDDVGARTTRAGFPSPRAVVRRVADAIRAHASLSGPGTVAASTLGTMAKRVAPVRALLRLFGRLRGSLSGERRRRVRRARELPITELGNDDAPADASPLVRSRRRGARAVRRRTLPGAVPRVGRRLLGRTARRPHGRLRDLLHRRGGTEEAYVLHAESDDPTAR